MATRGKKKSSRKKKAAKKPAKKKPAARKIAKKKATRKPAKKKAASKKAATKKTTKPKTTKTKKGTQRRAANDRVVPAMVVKRVKQPGSSASWPTEREWRQSGLCSEAQADGIPCTALGRHCEICEQADQKDDNA